MFPPFPQWDALAIFKSTFRDSSGSPASQANEDMRRHNERYDKCGKETQRQLAQRRHPRPTPYSDP